MLLSCICTYPVLFPLLFPRTGFKQCIVKCSWKSVLGFCRSLVMNAARFCIIVQNTRVPEICQFLDIYGRANWMTRRAEAPIQVAQSRIRLLSINLFYLEWGTMHKANISSESWNDNYSDFVKGLHRKESWGRKKQVDSFIFFWTVSILKIWVFEKRQLIFCLISPINRLICSDSIRHGIAIYLLYAHLLILTAICTFLIALGLLEVINHYRHISS